MFYCSLIVSVAYWYRLNVFTLACVAWCGAGWGGVGWRGVAWRGRYNQVCSHQTGHNEVVLVIYDPEACACVPSSPASVLANPS